MEDNNKTKTKAGLEPLTTERVLDLWSRTYNREGKPDWSHIFAYYHEEIIFEDSIQRIEGIEAFTAMCNRLTKRCEQLNMEILLDNWEFKRDILPVEDGDDVQEIPSTPIYGCTKLNLGEDNRIIYQRDYYDLWGDIFNGIPYFKGIYRRFMQKYFG